MTEIKLPRLVIDGRMVGPVPHGFARYVTGLAEGLRRVAQDKPLSYEPVFLVSRDTPAAAFAGFTTCAVGARFLSPLELIEIPRLLRRLEATVYHSPTFSSLRKAPCPWIVTVHDLNHLQFGGRSQKLYYEWLLKPFVRKASAVVSVSEFSRQELAAWSGIEASQIEIAYNSISTAFSERVEPAKIDEAVARHGLRRGKYFFSLTNSKPHKNLDNLLQGFGRHTAGWDLVLNLKSGQLPSLPGLKLIGAPDDSEVRALMAGAGAVVFASVYEGFGLPPVEAACLGVPVLISRIPPHREGLADLEQGEALWINNPKDPEAWSAAMDRAARGEVLGVSVASRSRLMKRFSPIALGLKMDGIYGRVLGAI
jgi:glycosyltransferase involved in cell wall biosynthesis